MDKFVDTNNQTILIAEKNYKIKNAKLKELDEVNDNLREVQRESKKIDNKIRALNNKIKTVNTLSKVEEIENQIEAFEKEKEIIDTKMQKATVKLANKLLEDVDEDYLLNNLTVTDSDLIMGIPQVIKLIKARTDEVKINNFVADWLRNITAKSLDNDYFR